MKIKVFKANKDAYVPQIIDKGDWIDLAIPYDVNVKVPHAETLHKDNDTKVRKVVFNTAFIDFGIAMELPKGYEAVVLPRSSTFKKYGLLLSNNMGVIDNTYCGENDTWKANMIAFNTVSIPKGTRICQFRVQLSQKATFWQKLKWLFSSKIELIEVDHLDGEQRNGFGSTGA